MDLMTKANERRQQDLQLGEEQIKLLQVASDQIGPAAMQIKQLLGNMPMAQAAYQKALAPILQNPNIPQNVKQQFPPQLPNDPQQATQLLDGAIQNSAKAREILKQQRADKHEAFEEKARTQQLGIEAGRLAEEKRYHQQQASSFSPDMGGLMAALAERGVSLPTGFRSKQQQAALYQGLLERNPGKSADEIAEGIAKGQIEFGAQKKETQTAAGVAGKVEVAQNELEEFIPLVREASTKVPRGSFVPINKLLQAGEASISDPNLKALRIRINSVLNAYDMLAARGGTDKDKRAEVRNLITSADSPAALEAGLKSF